MDLTMDLIWKLVLILIISIRVDHQETFGVKFDSIPSILPPAVDLACPSTNTTQTKPSKIIMGQNVDQYTKFDYSAPVLTSSATPQTFSIGFVDGSDVLKEKLLNSAGALSFKHLVQVGVFIFLALLLWNQRQEEQYIDQAKQKTAKFTKTKISGIGEMRTLFYSDQIHFTKGMADLTVFDKRMDKVSKDLESENANFETMYKCFIELKHDWNEQSHKIDQIVELPKYSTDDLIKEHQQELSHYIHHTEDQFAQINQSIFEDQECMIAISAGIDSIHDVLNEQSASEF